MIDHERLSAYATVNGLLNFVVGSAMIDTRDKIVREECIARSESAQYSENEREFWRACVQYIDAVRAELGE